MITIHAADLQTGDTIVVAGCSHLIDHIDRHAGWAWPVAADGTGWAMAIGDQLVDVRRTAP